MSMEVKQMHDGYREVQPTHRVESGGETYEYEYRFGEVHVDDAAHAVGDVFSQDDIIARVEYYGDPLDSDAEPYIYYEYEGHDPLIIRQDSVLAGGDGGDGTAEEDAYHALSLLESWGFVSGWRKR